MESNTNNTSLRTTYTEKLSRSATVLTALYMVPLAAQANVVHITTPLTMSIDDARAFDYQPIDWDVDGNSVADFRLEAFRTISYIGSTYSGGYSSSIPFGRLQLNSAGLAGQGMVQNTMDGGPDVRNLSLGETVGPILATGRQWGGGTGTIRSVMTSSNYFGFVVYPLVAGENLIGFRFLGNGDQMLYGWAALNLDEAALSMTIDQWAFEDNGGSISVGQVSSVPLPPSAFLMLSGLALGAGGVLRGRRQRKAEQDMSTDNS